MDYDRINYYAIQVFHCQQIKKLFYASFPYINYINTQLQMHR